MVSRLPAPVQERGNAQRAPPLLYRSCRSPEPLRTLLIRGRAQQGQLLWGHGGIADLTENLRAFLHCEQPALCEFARRCADGNHVQSSHGLNPRENHWIVPGMAFAFQGAWVLDDE